MESLYCNNSLIITNSDAPIRQFTDIQVMADTDNRSDI